MKRNVKISGKEVAEIMNYSDVRSGWRKLDKVRKALGRPAYSPVTREEFEKVVFHS